MRDREETRQVEGGIVVRLSAGTSSVTRERAIGKNNMKIQKSSN